MDHELIENCRRLDDAARNDLDALRSLYSDDFLIHRLDSSGKTLVLDKQALVSFLAGQRDEDAASQERNSVEYLHASKSGDIGMVVGKRTQQADDNPCMDGSCGSRGGSVWRIGRLRPCIRRLNATESLRALMNIRLENRSHSIERARGASD